LHRKWGPGVLGAGRGLAWSMAALVSMVASFFTPLQAGEQIREVTVSAAASLTNAFQDIGKAFEARQKRVKVHFNFAASGDLLRQIEGGAPVDVFASAAPREMGQLEAKGLIVAGTRRNFARNGLVLIRPATSPLKIVSFDDLRKGEVKRIAIGNPATVPAGMYAQQVLAYLRLWDDVKAKLVFGESVRQVLDYAARGEVDGAIVFSTDAGVRSREIVVVAQTPQESHGPIVYPIAVVRDTRNGDLAEAFIQFVLSP
jgi:molybdate transport system substrate-binding protein